MSVRANFARRAGCAARGLILTAGNTHLCALWNGPVILLCGCGDTEVIDGRRWAVLVLRSVPKVNVSRYLTLLSKVLEVLYVL